MGAVAILGWGSLIWDLDDLAPKVRGDWAPGAGPALPIEFRRVAVKRLDALTLCLCQDHGVLCRTAVIDSIRDDVEAAADDLARRERATIESIGFVDLETDEIHSRYVDVSAAIAVWCGETGRRGAVWTDLPPNFEDRLRQPFSVEAALEHFRGLETRHPQGFAEGVRYMHRAPAETNTPVRRAVAQEPWWPDAVAAHG